MRIENHLVIFTRAPRMGRGKSRLARDIGLAQTVRFQRVMLAHALRRLGRDRRWRTWLALTPDREARTVAGIEAIAQGDGDLGTRMARVARLLPPGPVVIVGSDIPGLAPGRIAQAFRKLGTADAVFGPAVDGGYWLVGLRRRPRFVDPFRHVAWSTPTALRDTLANLGGRQVEFVATLDDIDDATALRRNPGWFLARQAR